MLPVNVEGMPLWKKHDTLDNLTMDKVDEYIDYGTKINEYQFILNNLL